MASNNHLLLITILQIDWTLSLVLAQGLMWLQSHVAGVGVILKALSFTYLESGLRAFRQLVVETAGVLRATLSLSPWTLYMMASEKLDFLHSA